MGPPIRVMLFGSEACNPAERPTKAQTKTAVKLLLDRGADPNGSDANEMGLFYGHDGLEEIVAPGYRLPPDKAKMYTQGYPGKPAVQALIKKASAK
jgi:hypothetical protein